MRTVAPDPFATSDASLAEYGVIGAVAQWCDCLNGKAPLLKGLQALGASAGIEALALVRYAKGDVGIGQCIVWDRARADVRGGRLNRGFARALLGPVMEASRAGSIWFRSMVDEHSHELSEFHALRSMRELAVVPLETSERCIDTLELHFAERPRNQTHLLLNSLAPVVSATWRGRTKGLFTESLLQRSGHRAEAETRAHILSPENPARLSRSEYRVGLMLSRGLAVEEVKAALSIQESTLRTHLSSIYAKTRVTGLSELVFLLASRGDTGPTEVRRAGRLA